MQTDQINMIHNLIQLIEENIHENLDLDVLAEETGFSKYYIDRLFKALTGQTLINYVRGRRLTRSLDDLVNTRLHIIDIAQEYRFSYEQTYIRAFKQQFHMTPAQYMRKYVSAGKIFQQRNYRKWRHTQKSWRANILQAAADSVN